MVGAMPYNVSRPGISLPFLTRILNGPFRDYRGICFSTP